MLLTLIPALIIHFTQSSPTKTVNLQNQIELEVNIVPKKEKTQIEPIIEAKAAISIDVGSHTILYEKNINEPLAFASITKLMVAIIIIEENNLDEKIKIKSSYSNIEGSKIWLNSGEIFSYRNMLYMLLIPSANDVALALAEANSGNIELFVEKMNKKAKILGLNNTIFTNPVGLDDKKQKSSAKDLANLSLYAIQKPLIREIVQQKSASIESDAGVIRNLTNTNKLLDSYLTIIGLKTGTTDDAGQCLIALAKNEDNREIITIVLGSKDRFQESKALIDWTWQAYKW